MYLPKFPLVVSRDRHRGIFHVSRQDSVWRRTLVPGLGAALKRLQLCSPTPRPQNLGMSNKLGFHDMVSYGHKPTDPDYREWKDALQRGFDEVDAEQNTSEGASGNSYDDHPTSNNTLVSHNIFPIFARTRGNDSLDYVFLRDVQYFDDESAYMYSDSHHSHSMTSARDEEYGYYSSGDVEPSHGDVDEHDPEEGSDSYDAYDDDDAEDSYDNYDDYDDYDDDDY